MKLKLGLGLALLAASTAGWLLVAPTQLGGSTTYVTTYGDSMEPGFQTGDLAIIRPARSYNVGDITAYHSAELSTVIMHRIVTVEDGRYTLQGDNNDFLDPEQPTRDQLIGTLALRVPQGGRWLGHLTNPVALGAMTLFLLLSGGTTTVLSRRQRRKKRGSTVKPTPLPPALHQLPPVLRTAGAVVAALAVGSVALGLVSWNRPLTSAAAEQAPAESTSTVTFSYRATVPQSAAYDGTTVTEPQAVFRRLADEVDVEYVYDSETSVPQGAVQVTAELSTANGWQSSVPLDSPETFTGTSYTGSVQLNLPELQARADAAAKAIGDEPAGDVSVTVVPEISTDGETSFRPELPFTMSNSALRLAGEEPELTVSHSGPGQHTVGEQPARLTLLGQSVGVQQARTTAVGGLAAAVLAALVLAVLVRRAGRIPEGKAIQTRYAEMLLPVDPMVLPAGRPVVEVPEVGALVRLAERYGLFVMHWERGGRRTYVVLDDSATYRYRTAANAVASRPVAEDAASV